MGPNGNTTFIHSGLGGLHAKTMRRGAFHTNRGIKGTRVTGHGVRFLCRDTNTCIFVSARGCRRVRLGTNRVRCRLGCLGRGVRIGVLVCRSRAVNISLPGAMVLHIRRARPKVGNSATSNNSGPTGVRAKLVIGMPFFIGTSSVLVIGAASNSCMSHT